LKKPSNITTTVLVLLGIIIASGVLIPMAYIRFMNSREFRPPFEKALTKNIQILDDLRGPTSLSEFEDSIWIAYCSSSQEGNENALIMEKVKALRARFPETELKTAIFIVDATIEQKEALAAYRAKFKDSLTENDYVIAANVKVLQKYLKNEFRFALLPYEKEGTWLYDRDLIILDRLPADANGNRPILSHMRGHLDFAKAIELDQEAMKEGAKMAPYEMRLDQRLVDSIQYLIDNPHEEDPALSGEQKN